MNAGDELPIFETMSAGFNGPISTENLPIGVVVPTPTSPAGDERVEMVNIGMFAVEVEKLNAWSMPLGSTMSPPAALPKVMLPSESNDVVAVPPKYAFVAESWVVEALPLRICRPVHVLLLPR